MSIDELIAWVVAQKMYGTFSAHQFQLKVQEHAPQVWKHYEYWFKYSLSFEERLAKTGQLKKSWIK